ncbi:hypothetical protein EGW08_007909, partial [Elysia chlorotica]
EWGTRRVNYLGLSADFSLFVWEDQHRKSCLSLDNSYNVTTTRDEYKSGFVERLVQFCQTEENRTTNLDCFDLPELCTYSMPELPACAELNMAALPLSAKLWAEARDADADSDGTITGTEMEELLASRFNDTSCLTMSMWADSWSKMYNLSPEVGQFYYGELVRNWNCLEVKDMNIPYAGVPVIERASILLETIITMCEKDSTLYQTLPECAQLSSTCRTSFRSLPACKTFLDTCGMNQYVTCIQKLTYGACVSAADQWEIKAEAARARNQIKVNCRAETVLASFDLSNYSSNSGSSLSLTSTLIWLLMGLAILVHQVWWGIL